MAQSILNLIEGHDVISVNQDLEVVFHYAEMIQNCSLLIHCTPEMLHGLTSSINTCLASKNEFGKINGLVILQALGQQASQEVFHENGSSWLRLLHPILQKSQISENGLRLSCSILRIFVQRAPEFPEISKQVTTLVSPTIESMLQMIEKYPLLINDVVQTIRTFFKQYPGSCGPVISKVEKMLVKNISLDSKLQKGQLAKCLAMMPRLGGGGKDGIHHRANFVTLFQRLCYTLDDLLQSLLDLSMSQNITENSAPRSTAAEPFVLPKTLSKDTFEKSLFQQNQLAIVCQCLCALIEVQFPHPKSIRIGLVMTTLKKTFEKITLQDCDKMIGDEGRILMFCWPNILKEAFKVLHTLVSSCKQSVILLLPTMLQYILSTLADLRNFTETFESLRIEIYRLLKSICQTFGPITEIENHQKDIVSYLLSDILPLKPSVGKLASTNNKKNKKSSFFPTAMKEEFVKNSAIRSEALCSVNFLLQAIGPIMEESVYRQLTCSMISLGLDQECSKKRLPNDARKSLYQVLITLMSEGHVKTPPSLHLISQVFKTRLTSETELKDLCYQGLSLSMKCIHPNRAQMHLDLPLDVKTIDEIKDDLMKVHVYYTEASTSVSLATLSNSNPPIENFLVIPSSMDNGMEKDASQIQFEEDNGILADVSKEKSKLQNSVSAIKEMKETILKARETSSGMVEAENEDDELMDTASANDDLSEKSIFIPDHLKKRREKENNKDEGPNAKQPKVDNGKPKDDFLNAEEMLKDFVPVLK